MKKGDQKQHSSHDEAGGASDRDTDAAAAKLGYAHRAHSPDPDAVYSFNPEKTRVLPKDRRLRWKVTG